MSTIEKAVAWQLAVANNATHGYDQAKRWGPNYDCSSLVIQAWENAGVPVKSKGASYTGNMRNIFLKSGFEEVKSKVNLANGSGMLRGDVLLKEGSHVATYLGNGRIVHASLNENGKITGGKSGDQNGKEIYERSYYNKPWNSVLRYTGGGEVTQPKPSILKVGNDYTVLVNNLNIRTGPGANYRKKEKSELTSSGQKQSNAQGQYNAGTRVTAKEVQVVSGNTWIKTPSGWLCAIYNNQNYIG